MKKAKKRKVHIKPEKVINNAVAEIKDSESSKEIRADIRLLFRMLRDWHNKEYTLLSGSTIFIVIGAVLYIVSPIDVIPESIPVVGKLDDLSVLAYAIHAVNEELKNYKLWLDTKDMRAEEAIRLIQKEVKAEEKRKTHFKK